MTKRTIAFPLGLVPTVLVALTIVGCAPTPATSDGSGGGNDDGATRPGPFVSSQVGSGGGAMSLETSGGVEIAVEIPSGALPSTRTVVISEPDSIPAIPTSKVLPIEDRAVQVDLAGADLSQPISVTIPLELSERSRLQCIVVYDNARGKWYVPRQFASSDNAITAHIYSEGILTMVEAPESNDATNGYKLSDTKTSLTNKDLTEKDFRFGNVEDHDGDDMEFENRAPGYCWGMASFVAWYFSNHRDDSPLYDKYFGQEAVQENIVSEAHEFQVTTVGGIASSLIANLTSYFPEITNPLTIACVKVELAIAKRPVPISIYSHSVFEDLLGMDHGEVIDYLMPGVIPVGAHSVAAYYCDNGEMKVYDSNPDKGESATITYGFVVQGLEIHYSIDSYQSAGFTFDTFLYDPWWVFLDDKYTDIFDRYQNPPSVTLDDSIVVQVDSADEVADVPLSYLEIDEGDGPNTNWLWQVYDESGHRINNDEGTGLPPDVWEVELNVGEYTATLAVRDGRGYSVEDTMAITVEGPPERTAAPTFDPPDGTTFTDSIEVTIQTATDGASIVYTDDGWRPLRDRGETYGDWVTLELTETTTLRAFAYKDGMEDTSVVRATYTKVAHGQVATPIFDPPDGTTFVGLTGADPFAREFEVTISSATPGAWLSGDVSDEDGGSFLDSWSPITLTILSTTTITVHAEIDGMDDSETVSATYTRISDEQVATPTFQPSDGESFSNSLDVTIACDTGGATIRFTADGTMPSATNGTVYDGSVIHVTETTTVRAVASKNGMGESEVASATYTKLASANALPEITNASVTGSLTENQTSAISVACTAMDYDGTVEAVVVNLSAIGSSASQTLSNTSGDYWEWSGIVTPAGSGSKSVTFAATDDDGDTRTREVFVSVSPSGPGPDSLTLNLGDGVTMELVRIPAGTFMMGSDDGDDKERPIHSVTISRDYYIGRYEVTQAQWGAVMGSNPSLNDGCDFCPVEFINWGEAIEFCDGLSSMTGYDLRLPTEAEWEYACRADTTTEYSFSDDAGDLGGYAWYALNAWNVGERYAHPVGRKMSNPWGLYDMHGNVVEWCNDWLGRDYYSGSPTIDPPGPSSGTYRVARGGYYAVGSHWCRSAARPGWVPSFKSPAIGFRVAARIP